MIVRVICLFLYSRPLKKMMHQKRHSNVVGVHYMPDVIETIVFIPARMKNTLMNEGNMPGKNESEVKKKNPPLFERTGTPHPTALKVVGVGCGPGMLTDEGARVISAAALVYGSARAIALARPHIRDGCEVHEIDDYKALRSLPADAVVLSTGDPMLAGLGYLGGEVVPGISSMQVAFARLGVSLVQGVVVNAHGKDHAAAIRETAEEIDRGRVVFLIADPAFSVPDLAAALPAGTRIAVCEKLGYPEERIAVGTAAEPPVPVSGLFVVIAGF